MIMNDSSEYKAIKISSPLRTESLNKIAKDGWKLVCAFLDIDKKYIYYFVKDTIYYLNEGEVFEVEEP